MTNRDCSFLWSKKAVAKRRKVSSNIYDINGKVYVGAEECYQNFFKEEYPDLSRRVVQYLLFEGFLSKRNRDRYPELDPFNPDKIWYRLSRGAISRGHNYREYSKYNAEVGFIYFLLDENFNRYYGFTCRSVNDEFKFLREKIENGELGSTNPDDYEFHIHDIAYTEDGYDKPARELIDSLIKKFISMNPDRRAVNLLENFNSLF